jgi:hypothetical protein
MTAFDWLSLISSVLGILGFFVSILTYLKVESLRTALRKAEIDKQLIKRIKEFVDKLEGIPADKTTLTKTLAYECNSIVRIVRDVVVSPWPWKDRPIKKSLRTLSREAELEKMSKLIVSTHLRLVFHEISSR